MSDLPRVRRLGEQELSAIFECASFMVEDLGILGTLARGDRVVIKPNLFAPASFHTGRTTDPRLVEGICRRLMDDGIIPVLAEGSGAHYSGEYIFETTGYRRLADTLGIELVDLNVDRYERIPLFGRDMEVEFARTLLESRVIINVPKVKTHIQTAVTLAMKNLMGGLSKQGRVDFHFNGIHASIPALTRTLQERGHQVFCIADGIISMEGKGPFTGEARSTGFVLGATHPFMADLGLCHLMGFNPTDISHVREACALFGADETLLSSVREWASTQECFRFKPARSLKTGEFFSRWGTWLIHRRIVDLALYGLGLKPLLKRLLGRDVAVLDPAACVGCLKCQQVCPLQCFSPSQGKVSIDTTHCKGCMICVEFCPEGALSTRRKRL